VILVSLGLTTFLAFPPKNKAPPAAEHHHSLAAEHDWGGSCEAKLKLLTNVAANGGTHLYEQYAPWE